MTVATAAPNANKDRSNHAETLLRGGAEKTAPATPSNTDLLVALLIARPEIKSVSDLTGKTIAIQAFCIRPYCQDRDRGSGHL